MKTCRACDFILVPEERMLCFDCLKKEIEQMSSLQLKEILIKIQKQQRKEGAEGN